MSSNRVFNLERDGSFAVTSIIASTDPTPTVDFTGGNARLVLHLRSYTATLARTDVRRYSTADQWLDYPDDGGFEYVPVMVDAVVTFTPRSRLR